LTEEDYLHKLIAIYLWQLYDAEADNVSNVKAILSIHNPDRESIRRAALNARDKAGTEKPEPK
jgi:hypothetical protein